jgi:hypothetical protein
MLALLLSIVGALSLHAQRVPGESDYKLAPAIAGNNGRVFVGMQSGTILYATSSASGITVTDSATPGAQLPSEVSGVWLLSMPNVETQPQLVVGLVSYDTGTDTVYGAIRTTDMGASWTLIKDAALADTRFTPSSRFWDSTTLREVTWLADAQNGWIYGPGGIVATSDGGLTWSVRYVREANRTNVHALAFRDAMNGVAAMGWQPEERWKATTDGGATWALRDDPLALHRVNQIDWVGNEYRALAFDRSALSNTSAPTTYLYRSIDLGDSWDSKAKGTISVEQTYLTRILWLNARTGFMMMRSGEIAVSQDRGTTWQRIQNADSVSYEMPLGTNRGFGYGSIILDKRYIVQAATLRSDGILDTLVQWDLGAASVRYEPKSVVAAHVVPTPADDVMHLSLERATGAGARVRIVDAAGIIRRDEALEVGTRSIGFDLGEIAPGVYRVIVDDGDARTVAPLVVVR